MDETLKNRLLVIGVLVLVLVVAVAGYRAIAGPQIRAEPGPPVNASDPSGKPDWAPDGR